MDDVAQVLDALVDEAALVDAAGIILYVNAAWREFARENSWLGGRDGLGENYFAVCDSVVAPEGSTVPLRAQLVGLLTTDAGRIEFDYPCPTPTRRRWFRFRARSYRQDGNPRLLITHTDVTREHEEKQQRQSLLENLQFERNRLAQIFHTAPGFMVVLRGPDFVFELANAAYYRVVGFRQLIGRPAREALPEVMAQGFGELLQHVWDSGETYVGREMSVHLQSAPGAPTEQRFVDFIYQAMDEADGSRSGIISVGVDVTARVLAERQLRESEERYRVLVEMSPDGVLIHQNEIVTFSNSAAANILGAPSPAECVGRKIRSFIHDDSVVLLDRRLAMIAEGQDASAQEMRWIGADGATRTVEVASRPITYFTRPAVLTVFRDIGQRVHVEEQLREVQRLEALARLAGGIAHDFNNVLAVMMSYAGVLQEALPPTGQEAADLAEIQSAVDRAAALTQQLLVFGRQQPQHLEPVNVRSLLEAAGVQIASALGPDITTTLDLERAAELSVVVDREHFNNAIMHLAVRARHAMPRGGTLTVRVDDFDVPDELAQAQGVQAGRYAQVSLEDTGIAMSSNAAARAFDPFFITTDSGGNSGLGLAASYAIVRQADGFITVDRSSGGGNCFHIFLPLNRPLQSTSHEPEAGAAASSPHVAARVLLVEDEPALTRIVERILRAGGYEVVSAANPLQALSILEREGPSIHCLLSDVVMPGMSGPELAERVRERAGADFPVVLVSGYAVDVIERRGPIPPDIPMVAKPFTAAELCEAVRRAVHQWAVIRSPGSSPVDANLPTPT